MAMEDACELGLAPTSAVTPVTIPTCQEPSRLARRIASVLVKFLVQYHMVVPHAQEWFFTSFPKDLQGFWGSLASPWPLDPPSPPWKFPWLGNKRDTAI